MKNFTLPKLQIERRTWYRSLNYNKMFSYEEDVIYICTALTKIKTTYIGLKKIMILANRINILDKDEKILELKNIILKLKEDELINKKYQIEIIQENQDLKKKIKEVEEMIFEKGVFWMKNGSGPFCPTCFQSPQRTQAYLKNNNPKEKESWVCTACGKPHLSPDGHKRILEADRQARSDLRW